MSEVNQEPQVVDQIEVVAEQKPAAPNYESKAREAGWRPQEEFEGDPEQWISAKEFLQRGELYERIHRQSRELRQTQKMVQELAAHNQKVEQAAYERALADLRQQKRNALDIGDTEAVINLDDQILEVREAAKSAKQAVEANQNTIPPEYFSFAEKNTWYTKDKAMTAFADSIGVQLKQSGLTDPATFFRVIEQEVKKEFAHKFKRQESGPSAVEGATQSKAGGSKTFTPSEQEKAIAKQFVRAGVFKSEADYYKQLSGINAGGKQ